jgi:hypothetical protein
MKSLLTKLLSAFHAVVWRVIRWPFFKSKVVAPKYYTSGGILQAIRNRRVIVNDAGVVGLDAPHDNLKKEEFEKWMNDIFKDAFRPDRLCIDLEVGDTVTIKEFMQRRGYSVKSQVAQPPSQDESACV